jgi:hypothetical protein
MNIFLRIAERKIAEAMADGLFEDLPGRGKPLRLENDSFIPEDLRMAYRCLKNAGCLPPEIELRNEIISLRQMIDSMDDDKERVKRMRELRFKVMKLNMVRERPLPLHVEYRIVERLYEGKGRGR